MKQFFAVSLPLAILILMAGRGPSQPNTGDTDEPFYKGKPLSEWVRPSKDKNAPDRREAISALTEAVSAQLDEDRDWDLANRAVPAFTQALEDEDPEIRAIAAKALHKFGIGPEAEAKVSQLIKALQDKDPEVRRLAANLLVFERPAAKGAAPALTKALQDPEPS